MSETPNHGSNVPNEGEQDWRSAERDLRAAHPEIEMSGCDQHSGSIDTTRRRALLAAIGTTTLGGLAGCSSIGGGDGPTTTDAGVPGLRLALRADAGVTTDDEGRVETWADQSPDGNDFSAGSPESRPTLTEDAIGGHRALTFGGETDHLGRDDTLGIADDSPRTFAVVSRLAETTPRSPFLMQGEPGSSNQFYGVEANTHMTAGERFGVYAIGTANDSKRETDTNAHVHVLRTESFTNQKEVRNTTTYHIDGVETPLDEVSSGLGPEASFEGEETAIGAFPVESTPEVTHVGEIAEVRVYDRALTGEERSTVESAMADRYGIDLG